LFTDGAADVAWYASGGRGDSALGDSVFSTDDTSDQTSKHRGYSGDDDDDDDTIPDVINQFQVDDVTSYFHTLHSQYQRKLGNVASSSKSITLMFCLRLLRFTVRL